jgi:hypothetical protein
MKGLDLAGSRRRKMSDNPTSSSPTESDTDMNPLDLNQDQVMAVPPPQSLQPRFPFSTGAALDEVMAVPPPRSLQQGRHEPTPDPFATFQATLPKTVAPLTSAATLPAAPQAVAAPLGHAVFQAAAAPLGQAAAPAAAPMAPVPQAAAAAADTFPCPNAPNCTAAIFFIENEQEGTNPRRLPEMPL